jgi:hypothetical protein
MNGRRAPPMGRGGRGGEYPRPGGYRPPQNESKEEHDARIKREKEAREEARRQREQKEKEIKEANIRRREEGRYFSSFGI